MGKYKRKRPLAPVLAIAALGLACGACETVFVQPAESPAIAHVDYLRDPDLPVFGTGAVVSWTESPACAEVLKITAYDPMSSGLGARTSWPFRLNAGERVHMVAEIFGEPRAGFRVVTQCVNVVSFTPESGGRYSLLQRFNGGQCETAVTDQATGVSPPSFETHTLQTGCVRTPAGYERKS